MVFTPIGSYYIISIETLHATSLFFLHDPSFLSFIQINLPVDIYFTSDEI
jgi:hypothetical protein